MKQKLKKESGVIMIEATISLTAFMFAIVTILTIVNICIAQARIATAINITAKELSQYSYLYSLTGFSKSEAELHNAAAEETQKLNDALEGVSTIFSEVDKLKNNANHAVEAASDLDIDGVKTAWESAVGSGQAIQNAGTSLKNTFKDIAKDPKKLMFGIVKLAASESLELAKSKLIAAPLASVLCEKHLVSAKDESAETYLKNLGVVPDGTGSYMGGLDFSDSTLFPYGSNEITINVKYKIKVIQLLPLDWEFTFNQTAITHGWLAGEKSYTSSTQMAATDTLWTKATIQERSNIIRHMGIEDLKTQGYKKTAGLTDVQLYNKTENEFIMISSMNPLYSAEGETTKTVADIEEKVMKQSIERLCGKMKSTTDGLTTVTTKTESGGVTTKEENSCAGAKNKIVLVIPEDDGLKERMEEIIASADTKGVVIEVNASYGKGANMTARNTEQETQGGAP